MNEQEINEFIEEYIENYLNLLIYALLRDYGVYAQ
jgi:hypothetical protein